MLNNKRSIPRVFRTSDDCDSNRGDELGPLLPHAPVRLFPRLIYTYIQHTEIVIQVRDEVHRGALRPPPGAAHPPGMYMNLQYIYGRTEILKKKKQKIQRRNLSIVSTLFVETGGGGGLRGSFQVSRRDFFVGALLVIVGCRRRCCCARV